MRRALLCSTCALTVACGTWHGPGVPPSPGGDAGGGGGAGLSDAATGSGDAATTGFGDAATREGGVGTVGEAGTGSFPDASSASSEAGTGVSGLDAGTLDGGTSF